MDPNLKKALIDFAIAGVFLLIVYLLRSKKPPPTAPPGKNTGTGPSSGEFFGYDYMG